MDNFFAFRDSFIKSSRDEYDSYINHIIDNHICVALIDCYGSVSTKDIQFVNSLSHENYDIVKEIGVRWDFEGYGRFQLDHNLDKLKELEVIFLDIDMFGYAPCSAEDIIKFIEKPKMDDYHTHAPPKKGYTDLFTYLTFGKLVRK